MDGFTPDSTLHRLGSASPPASSVTSPPSDGGADAEPSTWPSRWSELEGLLVEASASAGDTVRLSQVSALGSHLMAALEGEGGVQAAHDLADLPADRRAGWIAALVLAGYQEPGGTREALVSSPAVRVCQSAVPLATQVNDLLRQLFGPVAFRRLWEGPHRSTLCTYVMLEALGPGDLSGSAALTTPSHGLASEMAAAGDALQHLRGRLDAARAVWRSSVRTSSEQARRALDTRTTPDFLGLGVDVRSTSPRN